MRSPFNACTIAALAGAFLFCAGPAAAQTDIISRITLDQMLAILSDADHEGKIVTLPNKSTAIQFSMAQLKDDVFAYPTYCKPAEGCLAFSFKAILPKYDKIDAALVNDWNSNLAISKAALRKDGSSEFTYSFSVLNGVTANHVKGAILLFEDELRQYLGFIAQR